MPELKASTTTYNVSPEEIQRLVAKDLGVDPDRVTLTFDMRDVSDDRFDRYPRYQVVGVTVTVDNK